MSSSPTFSSSSPSKQGPGYRNAESDKLPSSSPLRLSSPAATQAQLQVPASNQHESNLTQFLLPQDRPITEVIGEPFPAFDHQTSVVGPYEEETARDAIFHQGEVQRIQYYAARHLYSIHILSTFRYARIYAALN